MFEAISILIAYLLGSVPFGFLIPKMFGISDIRKFGSGNVGATNVWRAAGPIAGILVLVFDIGKGIGAVLIASGMPQISIEVEYLKLICGLAAIIGHIFPAYLKFRGGKGVNTALGVMLTLLPVEALVGLAAFVITVSLSRYISLGSMLGAVAFFAAVAVRWIFKLADIHAVYVVAALLMMVLIIFAHRTNIKRLVQGSENRFSFKARPASEMKKEIKNA